MAAKKKTVATGGKSKGKARTAGPAAKKTAVVAKKKAVAPKAPKKASGVKGTVALKKKPVKPATPTKKSGGRPVALKKAPVKKKSAPKAAPKAAPKPKAPAKKAAAPAAPAKAAAPKASLQSKVAMLKQKQKAEEEAKAARLKRVPELDRPTGTYNGILLCDVVKPFPVKSPYSKQELDRLREALLEERTRLNTEIASLQGVGREALELTRDHPGYSMHLAEHATDLQTAEANIGVRAITQERLDLVEDALDRIEKKLNRFGLCLACGNKIGIQRLIAQPHAHLCMDCRQKFERIKSRRGY